MAKTKYRKDYQPLHYQIKHTDLTFELDEHCTQVVNEMTILRTEHGNKDSALVLNGSEYLTFGHVKVNGRMLRANQYTLTEDSLTIHHLPANCKVTVTNTIDPTSNKSCEGLYRSDGLYTTQCESENFRKITYFQDRPDNLATYTTTVIADQKANPVLLGNGNKTSETLMPDGRLKATFHDPNPKPSYLFALVAGNLRTVTDHYITKAGKSIELKIHVTGDKAAKAMHAMNCLKKAFAWDEEKYGLPYDLDVYNIVGVPDFNAGAMENKGLNIFNEDAVLVSPQTATDRDYEWIYTVVGHEFFHNYAGNRVTVQSWFELALKEGLATQKENEFLADMIGYTQPRINKVNTLRAVQFPEDAGANAHPVRTDSYVDISNFYTTTTYYKGSELLSMLSGMLGVDKWREGCVAYFKECDGTAATIDTFLEIVGRTVGKDLTQFKRWYSQAGTPQLDFSHEYDAQTKTYRLTVTQSCQPTPKQDVKLPFHIPIKMALLDKEGQEIPLHLASGESLGNEAVLELTEQTQTFVFTDVESAPIPSLLRDFSAPVNVGKSVLSDEDLMFLMKHDTNEFNRYEAAQKMHERIIINKCNAAQNGREHPLGENYYLACKAILNDETLSPGLKADMLALPSRSVLLSQMETFDPTLLDNIMGSVNKCITDYLAGSMAQQAQTLAQNCPDEYSPENSGKRQLKNLCMGRLMGKFAREGGAFTEMLEKAAAQFYTAQNLTDKLAVLSVLFCQDRTQMTKEASALADKLMDQFYQANKHDPQLVSHWLKIQVGYDGPDAIEHIKALTEHECFSFENPNQIRDVLRVFMRSNHKHFHNPTGEGYAFIVDCLLTIDKNNPSMAADMAKVMTSVNNLDMGRLDKMLEQLDRLRASKISDKMREVVENAHQGYTNRRAMLLSQAPTPVLEHQPQANTRLKRAKAMRTSEVERLLEDAKTLVGDKSGQVFLTQFRRGSNTDVEDKGPRRSKRLAKH